MGAGLPCEIKMFRFRTPILIVAGLARSLDWCQPGEFVLSCWERSYREASKALVAPDEDFRLHMMP